MSEMSESNYRGTGCGKAARPGLWGSGEATNRSTRNFLNPTAAQGCKQKYRIFTFE